LRKFTRAIINFLSSSIQGGPIFTLYNPKPNSYLNPNPTLTIFPTLTLTLGPYSNCNPNSNTNPNLATNPSSTRKSTIIL